MSEHLVSYRRDRWTLTQSILPSAHIFSSSKTNWEEMSEEVPTFEKLPD